MNIFLRVFLLLVLFSFQIEASELTGAEYEDVWEEYENGLWDPFIEENEIEYQNYISSYDPLEEISSIDEKERRKSSNNYFNLLCKRRDEIAEVYGELALILEKHGIDPWCYFNGPKDEQDPLIVKKVASMSVGMLVLSLTDPEGASFMHHLELGLGMKTLPWPLPLEEIKLCADALRAIEIEFTIKSFLAEKSLEQEEAFDALLVLGCAKRAKVKEAVREILNFDPDEDSDVDDDNKYEAYRFWIELSESGLSELSILHYFDEPFKYLHELATGARGAQGEIEEECLPILLKHKESLTNEWYWQWQKERYLYLSTEGQKNG